jgi:hypothetical protein
MEELCPYLDAQKQPMHNMKDTLSDKDVSPIRSFSSLDKYVYPTHAFYLFGILLRNIRKEKRPPRFDASVSR